MLVTGKYVDYQGDTSLVGEVENAGTAPLKRIAVNIYFFNGDQLFRKDRINTNIGTLMPSMTSGFSLMVGDNNIDLLDK
ncbi:MAG TPA: hypothetical protein VHA09_00915 [Nitrososphaera sp.]|nr:hypothetical protein [Nitrososphaera sp.]